MKNLKKQAQKVITIRPLIPQSSYLYPLQVFSVKYWLLLTFSYRKFNAKQLNIYKLEEKIHFKKINDKVFFILFIYLYILTILTCKSLLAFFCKWYIFLYPSLII